MQFYILFVQCVVKACALFTGEKLNIYRRPRRENKHENIAKKLWMGRIILAFLPNLQYYKLSYVCDKVSFCNFFI